jgi:SET domain
MKSEETSINAYEFEDAKKRMVNCMNTYLSFKDAVLEANYIETLKYKPKYCVDLDIVFDSPPTIISYCTKEEDIRPLRAFPISTTASFYMDAKYKYDPSPQWRNKESEIKKKSHHKMFKSHYKHEYYWIAHPLVYILKNTNCSLDDMNKLEPTFTKVGIHIRNENNYRKLLKPIKSFLNYTNIKIKNPTNFFDNLFCNMCKIFLCHTHFHKKDKDIYRLCSLPIDDDKSSDIKPALQIQYSQCTTVELVNVEQITPMKVNYTLKKYIPCYGKTCLENFSNCDIYCDSLIKFKGCHCKVCGARCPCFLKYRECHPLLCHKQEVTFSFCINMRMLLNKRSKLLLGKSSICNGYGLFAGRNFVPTQTIGEYTGELIWRGEEYLRSLVCYANKMSYLFPTNDEETIDAFLFGCKIRYINHSIKPNCSAIMLRSSGQDKILILAAKYIQIEEELFLNYGENLKCDLK